MINYGAELEKRIAFIARVVQAAGASGVVFGSSGGKDSALVGILCKKACENTLALTMPCESKRNYEGDYDDAMLLAKQFGIETLCVDLSETKAALLAAMPASIDVSAAASSNIAPRLRMAALYSVAASKNLLVAGTSNKSEIHVGYFTKHGDSGCDFNPIADLTVTEVYDFLKYLEAPPSIISKAPSAGLFEGQTDEAELGVTYAEIDELIQTGRTGEAAEAKINLAHEKTAHKRKLPIIYGDV